MRVLCWTIGFFLLVGWVIGSILHPWKADIPHDNFFIKYALDIFIYNVVVLMLILPFLMEKGIISSDYHNDNQIGKAKFKFVVLTIVLPGTLSVLIAFTIVNLMRYIILLMACIFLYVYIESIFLLLRNRKKG